MKRVYLYDKNEKLIFSGSLCDLPIKSDKVRSEAARLYGDRLCTDRLKAVKERFITELISAGEILDENSASLLEYDDARRLVIDDD